MRLNLDGIQEPLFEGPIGGQRNRVRAAEAIFLPQAEESLYSRAEGLRGSEAAFTSRRAGREIDLTPEWTATQKILKEIDSIHGGDGPLEWAGDFVKKFAFPVGGIALVATIIGNSLAAIEAIPGVTAIGEITGAANLIWHSLPWIFADPTLATPLIAVGGAIVAVFSLTTLRAIEAAIEKAVG